MTRQPWEERGEGPCCSPSCVGGCGRCCQVRGEVEAGQLPSSITKPPGSQGRTLQREVSGALGLWLPSPPTAHTGACPAALGGPAPQHKPQRSAFAEAKGGQSALPLGSSWTLGLCSLPPPGVESGVRNGIILSPKLTERSQTHLFAHFDGD